MGVMLDQIGVGWQRWADISNIIWGMNGSSRSGAILMYIRWFVKEQLQCKPGLID